MKRWRMAVLGVGACGVMLAGLAGGGTAAGEGESVPTCVVPNVINVRLQAAEEVLKTAGCYRGPLKAKALDSNEFVFIQSPRAGVVHPEGSVLVSLSKVKRTNLEPNCEVPRVLGMTARAAVKPLLRAGC